MCVMEQQHNMKMYIAQSNKYNVRLSAQGMNIVGFQENK